MTMPNLKTRNLWLDRGYNTNRPKVEHDDCNLSDNDEEKKIGY